MYKFLEAGKKPCECTVLQSVKYNANEEKRLNFNGKNPFDGWQLKISRFDGSQLTFWSFDSWRLIFRNGANTLNLKRKSGCNFSLKNIILSLFE